MVKVVLFDMDGVLVDSEVYWKNIEREHLRKLIPEWDESILESTLGRSMDDSYRIISTRINPPISWGEFSAYYHEQAKTVYGERCSLFPGVVETLQTLLGNGLRLGLVSSSPLAWISIVIERFSLSSFFSEVVSADELDGPGKPDPGVYRLAVSRFGVKSSECVAVEDTANGIQSAKGANLYCIAFSNGFNEKEYLGEADVETHSFAEILFLCAGGHRKQN